MGFGRLLPVVALATVLTACGGGGAGGSSASGNGSGSGSGSSTLSPQAQLGEKIFSDTALSASGLQSCASCHVAQYAFTADPTASGPDHGSPVPLGGPNLDQPGFRNTPSLMYASYTPAFYYDSSGDPYGGFFRDGRAATLAIQATQPFTTPFEMANADAAAVIAKLQTRPYLADFEAIYGAAALSDPQTALQDMGAALAAFETEDPQFHPFSSKYDAFLAGKVQLTAQEQRGLADFNDPSKGNCAACHSVTTGPGGRPPDFTDHSFHALGVPRNPAIPANREPRFFDLGLCGPLRIDLRRERRYCGYFKTPTLRNAARRRYFFHNGRFGSLREVLRFYVRRDLDAALWYPRSGGRVLKFDDLPASLRVNVDTSDAPLNRDPGDPPALSEVEIGQVVAFLETLSDAD